MTTHPEIQHPATEERIRAIAYTLWEEEGQPQGRDLDHWLRASELVAAEAAVSESPAPEPVWLERKGTAVARDKSRKAA
jgi:hypothetical protein